MRANGSSLRIPYIGRAGREFFVNQLEGYTVVFWRQSSAIATFAGSPGEGSEAWQSEVEEDGA